MELGHYYGQCSELCGVNHGFMPIEIYCVDMVGFAIYKAALAAKIVTKDIIETPVDYLALHMLQKKTLKAIKLLDDLTIFLLNELKEKNKYELHGINSTIDMNSDEIKNNLPIISYEKYLSLLNSTTPLLGGSQTK